jgi:nucleoside-triphosphatase THEP1
MEAQFLLIIRYNPGIMASDQSIAAFAAAVYKPDTGDRMALYKFVEKQKALNTRIGGVLQEGIFDSQGAMTGLNAIDVSNDHRIPISRPVQNDDDCGLDVAALAGTTGIISKAISDGVDLVVVEKFGEQEQNGKGLIDEVLQAIVAGIPLLISVPEAALPAWQERTGELGSVLPFTEDAFRQWWQGRQQASPNRPG